MSVTQTRHERQYVFAELTKINVAIENLGTVRVSFRSPGEQGDPTDASWYSASIVPDTGDPLSTNDGKTWLAVLVGPTYPDDPAGILSATLAAGDYQAWVDLPGGDERLVRVIGTVTIT